MFTVNSVKNVAWADPTGYRIDMDVDFDDLDEEFVRFTAYKNDCEQHSVDLFNRAVNGEFGVISEYQSPAPLTGEDAILRMRKQRTRKLEETDYVENTTYWNSLSEEKQSQWSVYRNALRDITDNVSNPVYTCTEEVSDENPELFTTTWTPNFDWPVKP